MPTSLYQNQFHPGYIASRLYPLYAGHITTGTAVAAIDTIYFFPFVVPKALTFTSIKVRTQTGGAGSSMKSGIWANSSTSFRPLGAPLFVDNTGQATTASNTTITTAMAAGTLKPNKLYWFGSKFTGTLPTMWSMATSSIGTWLHGVSTLPTYNLSYADTYSNNMPTISEGASFTEATNAVTFPWAQT